jgi:hypothetical protein
VLWLALFGCPRQDCDTGAVGALELGRADAPFTALQADEQLAVEMGPQGGWHTWVGLRATGLDLALDAEAVSDLPVVSITLSDGGEAFGGYVDLPRPFTGAGELLSERVVLLGDPSPHLDVSSVLEATITDRCGVSASATAEIRLTAP